jgi:biliverdin reductase
VSLYRYVRQPLRVGIVGTGFVAKVRAQSILADERTKLIAVTSSSLERAQAFATELECEAVATWQELVARTDIDLVVICSSNENHGPIAKAAIDALRHVIVEYPLSLNPREAQEIIFTAANRQLFLHVEHIELLGSLHQTMKEWMEQIGQPQYARYATLTPQQPAPRKWTYNRYQFGFPLIAALSRLHRFTDLFGQVELVNCQNRYWGVEEDWYHTSLCTAQLTFTNGLFAEVAYGKGENIWVGSRRFEVQGDKGAMVFDGDRGTLVVGSTKTEIELGSRKGMFAQDLQIALDHLFNETPNYVTPSASLDTLLLAEACYMAAEKQAPIRFFAMPEQPGKY